jgi:tetratricopeptide (TPR) repeat protein
MAKVSRDFPDDTNAAALAALALFERPESDLAAAQSNRSSARRVLAAVQRRGEHAGVAHFAMLTADDAASAARVVDTAYASAAAGSTAYALHLPSHVFIRRGLWGEAIDANLRAADAARRDGQVEDELHALDALVYALLQLGKDAEAVTIAARAQALGERVTADGGRAAEARAAVMAMPARVPLERGEWSRAAALPVPSNAPAWAVQVTRLARALGSARSGDPGGARRELAAAGAVDPTGAEDARGPVAAAGVVGLRQVAQAWTAFAEGQVDGAVDELQRAAASEAARDAADWPVSTLVSAQESLADMLLQLGRSREAVAAFQAALTVAPHRLRSIVGAAEAAERSGQAELAAGYAARLAAVAAAADRPLRPSLAATLRPKR